MRADTKSTGFRLKTARGHLDAVVRMVEDDRYCIDVLHQLSAVQGALDGIKRDVIEAHLEGCLPQAAAEGRIDEVTQELMSVMFGSAPGGKTKRQHCHASPDPVETTGEEYALAHMGAGI